MTDRDQRLHGLLRELKLLGVEVRLDGSDLHVKGGSNLTAELCDEIAELRPELIEYLRTEGETVIDDDAPILNATPPAPELSSEDKLRAGLTASKRLYMNGEVLVNHPNNMGAYMRRLREERERRQAAERGDAPPAGRYVTRFNVFE